MLCFKGGRSEACVEHRLAQGLELQSLTLSPVREPHPQPQEVLRDRLQLTGLCSSRRQEEERILIRLITTLSILLVPWGTCGNGFRGCIVQMRGGQGSGASSPSAPSSSCLAQRSPDTDLFLKPSRARLKASSAFVCSWPRCQPRSQRWPL